MRPGGVAEGRTYPAPPPRARAGPPRRRCLDGAPPPRVLPDVPTAAPSAAPRPLMPISARAGTFTESVIREMTRVAAQHGAINLAQGFPDFAAPDLLKQAACAAILADVNQYAVTWGTPRFRRAIAEKYDRFYGMDVDEAREIKIGR